MYNARAFQYISFIAKISIYEALEVKRKKVDFRLINKHIILMKNTDFEQVNLILHPFDFHDKIIRGFESGFTLSPMSSGQITILNARTIELERTLECQNFCER